MVVGATRAQCLRAMRFFVRGPRDVRDGRMVGGVGVGDGQTGAQRTGRGGGDHDEGRSGLLL
jgi:hypothetical protein